MAESTKLHPITIDLNQFKLRIELKNRIELTLHFNSPSRRFYLSVIALIVNEMKKLGKMTSIPLEGHHDLLALLNETIGESAGSSDKEKLLPRIYRKWEHALPNLEEAPLFMVLGRKKGYEEAIGKTYHFTETEKDSWANLFEYKGSEENVRLKFAIDKIGASLNDIVILYEDSLNADAWERFISSLKEKGVEKQEAEPDKRVSEEPEVPAPPLEKRRISLPRRYRWVALMAAIVVVLGTITLAIKKGYFKPRPDDVASTEKMAFPLPDVPSIAVLPFVNLSEDPKQEFLCDGITDEIITALSKLHYLLVISRQSTFFYKVKAVKVKQVSEELGVRYVLEGSVQRLGDRVRITAQLIDALTGNHLWAERYDRDLKDIFALQDEITLKIVSAMQVKLIDGEQFVTGSIEKSRLECYLKIHEGFKVYEGFNIEATRVARRIAEEAIAMCPDYPYAYVLMGFVHLMEFLLRIGKSPQESIEKGIEMAQKALAIDDSTSMAHSLLCSLYICKREYDKAIAEGERAVAHEPSGAFAHEWYAASLSYAGRPEEAIPIFKKAIRLNPVGNTGLYNNFGTALLYAGRFEEAVSAYKKALQRAPDNIPAHIGLAGTYSLMGREKEARAEAEEVLRLNPKFSLEGYAKIIRFKDQAQIDRNIEALRRAGLK
jgi:adenylate cyclase